MLPILFVVLLFTGINLTSGEPFTYSLCESDGSAVDLRSVNIAGDPVEISKNSPVKMSIDTTLKRDISNDAMISLTNWKAISIFGRQQWLQIPCIAGYGSCSMPFCEYFEKFNATYLCSFLQSIGKPCSCPLQAGDYVAKDVEISADLSSIPQAILNFADGDVKTHAQIQIDGKTVFCMDASLTIKLDQVNLEEDENSQSEESEEGLGGWIDLLSWE